MTSTVTKAASATQARDVQVFPIGTDTLALRSRSWNRLRFEVEYALERGTTANSFIIRGEKTALIDPPGGTFTEIYLAKLQELSTQNGSSKQGDFFGRLWAQVRWVTQETIDVDQFGFNLKQLDYLILGHVNPNRAETLDALLKLVPDLTIVCSNAGAAVLRTNLPDRELKLEIIKNSETQTLDLGKGHQLQFVPTPTPRWPGSLLTYDARTRILFSDKFFGAHRCGEAGFDEDAAGLREDRRYYYDCLMAAHVRQVNVALEKIKPLGARMYAPDHGPIARYGVQELTQSYENWGKQQQTSTEMVAVLYASAYGNTATIGDAIARGITKAGVQVESINCEAATTEEIQAAADKCDGFIIGSPTLGGHAPTQIQAALGLMLSTVPKDKPVGVFGSFGWSGEAIDLLQDKLRDAGYSFGFEPIKVKFKPTAATLKTCEEAGTDFAQGLKKAKKAKARRQGTTKLGGSQITPTEQAMGRIVGSLCILTAQQGEVSSGMLASWVSQATFTPPGLTVAVAKDRAVESLLYTKNSFVLNVLPEDNYQGLMKHFLKPFGPGEDRFADVETEEADNGGPILKDALSYLECEVENRMECGDHWVIYAVVKNGQVLKQNVKTALHHRKSGRTY
ncbi:MAG: diflavin flavoprotein [Cyanobacteria bacterium P01_A01_bin.17]